MNLFSQGFVTGGKDGVVGLWDQTFSRCLKTYKITRSSVRSGISSCSLLADSPPVRAISLGQGKILVGTTNSEVWVMASFCLMYLLDKVYASSLTHPVCFC